ncbi:MAG: protein translocase subunit SecD [Hyphomonadaceae bacterium]|nr:protein translocase subunit SecD [Hyphomonadaceae bacterium]
MLQVARWRVILVLVVTALGILFAAPNVLPQNVRQNLPPFLQRTINLGLDLRGGSQLLLEIDVATLRRQQLENIQDQMLQALREAEPQIRATRASLEGDAARVRLNDPAELDRAMTLMRDVGRSQTTAGGDVLEFTQTAEGVIESRMTEAHVRELSRQAAQQSIEVIRRRIDPDGTAEISIARQGDDRIAVQAPGVTDPAQLRERIGQTALMTFHMVREVSDEEAAAGRIPPGAMVVQPYPGVGDRPDVVERRPRFTGEHLVRANATTDSQTGQFALGFALDNEGSQIFCRITRQFTGQRFAILLDNQVLTAPTINEPICGGQGQITGNFTAETANNLAIMLRAGALPAPLSVIEQRTVTAELGQAAINAGQTSTYIAFGLVLLFMVLAYGLLFGGISVVALVVNGVLIMAIMTLTGAALTLPGVAGLILTLAVALDANVLIYERMREEAKAGRQPAIAIDAGFSRAMLTIFDANLTHLGAAFIMLNLAPPGPVKGFAWTLLIGVFTSVFTAVLITQVLVAWWFRVVRPKKLPIV